MYVVDTNVFSEFMRPEPASSVAAWFYRRNALQMHLTAVNEAELRYGVAILLVGKRRAALEAAMISWIDQGFGGRILPFDSCATRAYAESRATAVNWASQSARQIAKLRQYAGRAGLLC